MHKMKVSCIQMDVRLAEPEYNFRQAKQLLRQAAQDRPDVLVLPETWNTGFFPRENLEACCDQDGARVKEEIGALAKELGINIVAGSVANIKAGKVYNTAYVFDRTGNCIADYDKSHLFTPMGEHEFFVPGDHLCSFTLDGVRCGLIICYDIRFPELTRSLALQGMDLLFVVSQWPAVRIPHLNCLTQARAIENQMFLALCNGCGTADGTLFGGNSAVIDPWGEILVRAEAGETVIHADCDLETVRGIRSSINVFRDRKPELYQI